jgi:hypothetical protein
MRTFLALLTTSLLCLSGCGGTSAAGPAPGTNTLTGNWSFAATATTGPSLQIGAYLINSSGTLTGTMHVTNNNGCYPITTGKPENIPFTGTYNSSTGAVSITSSAVSSQVITINGTIASNTSALTGGTYSIAGGCAGGDAGSITGNEDSSLTYTYSGSLTSPSATFSAALTEQGPDQNGLYSVATATSPISYTGTTCFTAGLPNGITYVTGNYVYLTIVNNDVSSSVLTFTGAATSYTGQTITGTYSISGGTCDGDSGTLTMSHP